jgi:hypothetical protein
MHGSKKGIQGDLRAFHAKHLPTAALPEQFFLGADTEPEDQYYTYQDDGLGYYEDGIKRTLTDEQIALFRHTEIQTILRERRHQREAEESLDGEGNIKDLKTGPDEASEDTQAIMEGDIQDTLSHVKNTRPIAAAVPSSTRDAKTGPSVVDKVQTGRVEKQTPWKQTSSNNRQQRRNAKNRKKNRQKRAEGRKARREGSTVSGQTEEDGSSDEWDPWKQATGPDAQKDPAVELDY